MMSMSLRSETGWEMKTRLGLHLTSVCWLAVLTTFLFLAAIPKPCFAEEAIRFIPQWIPQAQFAGYYVAFEKGFFQDRGLSVRFVDGGPDRAVAKLLERGEADVGTMFLAEAIHRRAEGAKLVNVGQLAQSSSLMLVAKKSSGILRPEDLNGRKVSLWENEFELQPKSFFRAHNIEVQPVRQSVTVNLFLRGGVDAASAMFYNEYHTILNSGLNPDELVVFLFKNEGFDFPEDGIYCSEELIVRRPDDACAFVQAAIDGWKYAFENEEEALDIVMKFADEALVETNRVQQRWMLKHIRTLIEPPLIRGREASQIGLLREQDYRRVASELKNGQLISVIPEFSGFYRKCVR